MSDILLDMNSAYLAVLHCQKLTRFQGKKKKSDRYLKYAGKNIGFKIMG